MTDPRPEASHLAVAAVWKRVAAALVEALPLSVIALIVKHMRAGRGAHQPGPAQGLWWIGLAAGYQIGFTTMFGQTLGQMAMGIRVVDRDSGTPPTLMRATVRWAVPLPPQLLGSLLPMPQKAKRTIAALEQIQPEFERLRHAHDGTGPQFEDAVQSLYQDHGLNPFAGCVPVLLQAFPGLAYTCSVYCPVVRAPLHQGLHDRLANTVVVDARKDAIPGP